MPVMKAFSLANAGHLPLTGDLHPLRREELEGHNAVQ